jgi:hypothetical protein
VSDWQAAALIAFIATMIVCIYYCIPRRMK